MKIDFLSTNTKIKENKVLLVECMYIFLLRWKRTNVLTLFTADLENVPDSQSSAYRRKYYHLLEQNVLSECHSVVFNM